MSIESICFGKLSSRGDFVQSAKGSPLTQKLDEWISQAINLMSDDPRWKLTCDNASSVHFAILGPAHQVALIGDLVPSRDASGRRFPFVRTDSFEVPELQLFLPCSAHALLPVWPRQPVEVMSTLPAQMFQDSLLHSDLVALELRAAFLEEDHAAQCRVQTLAQLALAISASTKTVSVWRMLLALGMLLQPALTQGHAVLSKGLKLPLPNDPMQVLGVLSLWISLIALFFRKTNAELAFMVTRQGGALVLLAGFHGLSPVTLRATFDPDFASDQHIQLIDSCWVEEWVKQDYGLNKLSTVLRDSTLPWAAACELFYVVFLGEWA